MTRKTLKDCAACPMISFCDAHVSGGIWKHREGMNPCEVILEEKNG